MFMHERFSAWRKSSYSQQELANQLGVTNRTISQWENGIRTPTIEHLDQIHAIAQQTGFISFYDPMLRK
jgi:transcriptional regulator with XRE-family HTH domain